MSRQWTDEDVARMLGWEVIYGSPEIHPAFEKDGKLIWWKDSCFGLSTPPGPEADANVARYVLPWLRENHLYFGYAWFKMLFLEDVTVTLVQYGEDAQDESKDVLLEVYDDHFCKAICTAALEAYHAGSKDNE